MKNIFDFISEELSLANLTPKDLAKNKYRQLKKEYVHRAFTRYIETEYKNESREKTVKLVRSQLKGSGVTFSNKLGRETFDELRQLKPQLKYATKLKSGQLPSDENIPLIEYNLKGIYLYGFKIYLYDGKSKQKFRSMPKNSNTVKIQSWKYNKVSDFVFFSEIKLNKRDALTVMEAYLSGKLGKLGGLQEHIQGSDYKSVLHDNSSEIVGFSYDRLART